MTIIRLFFLYAVALLIGIFPEVFWGDKPHGCLYSCEIVVSLRCAQGMARTPWYVGRPPYTEEYIILNQDDMASMISKTLKLIPVAALLLSSAVAFAGTGQASASAATSVPATQSKGLKTVSVEALPKSVAEFKTLREKIGKTPEGVVALQVIAIGMYSEYGQSVGEECLDMINTVTGLTDHARGRLREWYVKGINEPRPYQAAAYMKGATPENGYNPTKPYTMEMNITEVRETEDATLYTVRLKYSGSQTSKDIRITVKQPDDDPYCYINANPSMYMKVRAKKKGTTYNGLK